MNVLKERFLLINWHYKLQRKDGAHHILY